MSRKFYSLIHGTFTKCFGNLGKARPHGCLEIWIFFLLSLTLEQFDTHHILLKLETQVRWNDTKCPLANSEHEKLTRVKDSFVVFAGWGRGGGSPDFKWQGWSKDFLGLGIYDSWIFLGRKIWQIMFLCGFACVFARLGVVWISSDGSD